jgi:hypothetical protein
MNLTSVNNPISQLKNQVYIDIRRERSSQRINRHTEIKALCISYVPKLQATSKPHPGPIGLQFNWITSIESIEFK